MKKRKNRKTVRIKKRFATVTREIKVFLIHQWSMSELQATVIEWLSANPAYKIIDYSYTYEKQISEHRLIQDYSCGAMMESDIVIVLPDWVKDSMPSYFTETLIPLGQTGFRANRGLVPPSIYTEELQTLMYDICNSKPALVLGWNCNTAMGLTSLLADTQGRGEQNTNPWRFYYMGLDELERNPAVLSDIVVDIIESHLAKKAEYERNKVDQMELLYSQHLTRQSHR